MLDLDPAREGAPPRDAATLVLLRDRAGGGVEIFGVERHVKSAFLGGAVVFPGGKVDAADRDPAWSGVTTAPRPAAFASTEADLRAFAVAACREALEEAALLPVAGRRVTHDEALELRRRAKTRPLVACVGELGLVVDLDALHPFARWVTPTAEARRFDARFYLAKAPEGQRGAHDDHETTASFWATATETLARFDAGAIQLAPPTHRTLEALAPWRTVEEALRSCERADLEPICPRLVPHRDASGVDTMALALPGDPAHDVREPRVAGASRFVLRGDRWLPGAPPSTAGV